MRRLSDEVPILTTVGMVVVPAGIVEWQSSVTLALPFFEAVAQLIPVLMIAFFVELAVIGRRVREVREKARQPDAFWVVRREEGLRFEAVQIFAVLFVGEAAALWALGDKPTTFLSVVCGLSVLGAGIKLCLMFLERAAEPPDNY